ncbi:MAG: hypothetical protein LBQ38_13225 [Spirochaetaceae bacterium]|nr:hypothetical protein [Spirochaetaceae bacterium]
MPSGRKHPVCFLQAPPPPADAIHGAFSSPSFGGGSVSSPLKHQFQVKTAEGDFYNGSDGA